MKFKNLFLIVASSLFGVGFPFNAISQEFDERIGLPYYYRSLNNVPVIRDASKHLDGINNADFPKVSVPASALLDLRIYYLDEKITIPFNAALERFNYIYADKAVAIEAIEKIFELDRVPPTYQLAAVISLAVITHNNGDYLKSIKYVNWWHSYTPSKRHQLYYLLADNYLKLGDRKNAYQTHKMAEEYLRDYLDSGTDMRDELGIENYQDKVANLRSTLGNLNEGDIQNEPSPIEVPAISDKFWVAKLTPRFPRNALSKGKTGYVDVKFDLDRKGNPVNITVEGASNSLFKKNTMSFMEDLKYIQYQIPSDEEYIANDVTYRVEFKYTK